MKYRSLYEDFTVKGKWWIPPKQGEQPEEAAGQLVVKAGNNIRLELYDPLRVGNEPARRRSFGLTDTNTIPVVWGEVVDGPIVTLFDCLYIGGTTASSGRSL